jgi:hypothetical protein
MPKQTIVKTIDLKNSPLINKYRPTFWTGDKKWEEISGSKRGTGVKSWVCHMIPEPHLGTPWAPSMTPETRYRHFGTAWRSVASFRGVFFRTD